MIGVPSANEQLLTFIFVSCNISRNKSFSELPPCFSTICQGSGTYVPGYVAKYGMKPIV